MTEFDGKGQRPFNQRPRPHRVAEHPLDDGKESLRARTGIHAEAELNFAIPVGIATFFNASSKYV